MALGEEAGEKEKQGRGKQDKEWDAEWGLGNGDYNPGLC